MKKNLSYVLLIAAMAATLLLSSPRSVEAGVLIPPKDNGPAVGSWSWENEEVTGTIIPQYQLAPTNDDDYALLQSEGIYLSGGTQLCHPYPGGQFGWNAEIRVLTAAGWQSVPTMNQWVPDEEGNFMTCANVWVSGTYAVFGYWVKPEGWGLITEVCEPVIPEGYVYVGPVNQVNLGIFRSYWEGVYGTHCVDSVWVGTDSFSNYRIDFYGGYCACDAIYIVSDVR